MCGSFQSSVFSSQALESRALFALLGLIGATASICAAGASVPPEFAVRTADGQLQVYSARDGAPALGYAIANDAIEARVDADGPNIWKLSLKCLRGGIREVWFPWESATTALGGDISDDVIYYPRWLGVAEKADACSEGQWREPRWAYPGGCFAPLVVDADEKTARIVAAVNWPPMHVAPQYGRGRLGMLYREPLRAGQTQEFHALVATFVGDPGQGVYAWHLALDAYKSWLKEGMRAAGLYPIDYPEALRNVHGWMNVTLHHLPSFDVDELRRLYDRRGDVFPWIQCWGQMSNFLVSPRDGLRGTPSPPLQSGEQAGCCLPIPRLHPRYAQTLPEFAREVARRGGYVGYYSRPQPPYGSLVSSNSPDLAFFEQWLEQNAADGANAYYLDVVGAKDFGDLLGVARLLQSRLPRMSVIEFPLDVYPSAFLVSGSLWGGRECAAPPFKTPADLGPELPQVTVPRFGRYLLDDRIMFLGRANEDWMFWGTYRGHDHFTERQVFLLGTKIDAPTRYKGQPGWIDPVNDVVRAIIDQRERVGWWQREPVYRDRAGISDVSPGVDVRRFTDKDGINLFAIENWQQQTDATFRYRGRPILVAPLRQYIAVLPAEQDPEAAGSAQTRAAN